MELNLQWKNLEIYAKNFHLTMWQPLCSIPCLMSKKDASQTRLSKHQEKQMEVKLKTNYYNNFSECIG